MELEILLIKDFEDYPLEKKLNSTSFNLNITVIEKFVDALDIHASDFDVMLLGTGLDLEFNDKLFQKISVLNIPLVILTSEKNQERAYELTEHCLFTEQLNVSLLEKSLKLAIQEKQIEYLNKKIDDYQNFLRSSKNTFNEDMNLIIQKEKAFFDQYNTTKSELQWLEILLNAIPSGIIILDSRDSNELYVNQESLKFMDLNGNDSKDHGGLIRIKDMNNFNFFTVDGERICDDELPFIKAINGKEIKDLELIVKKSDNEMVVMINSSPIYNKSGSVVASITAISDMSQLKKAEEDLIQAINISQIISEELNDRMLNILQTLTSLLFVNEKLDTRERFNPFYLNENKIRIKLIKHIHEKLSRYDDDDKYIDLQQYVNAICSELMHINNVIYNKNVELKVEGNALMSLDLVLACGLIIDEIISFRLGSFQSVSKLLVKLKAQNGRITIDIIDNGPKPDTKVTEKELKLTHVLLEQLSGLLRIEATSDDQTSLFIEILYLDI